MLLIAVILLVPIVLLMLWAVIYDLRRRGGPLTDHNPRSVARKTRAIAEGKGVEWGGS